MGAVESAAAVVLETDGSFSIIPREAGSLYSTLSNVAGFSDSNVASEYDQSEQNAKNEHE
jgi:hypothetical protein